MIGISLVVAVLVMLAVYFCVPRTRPAGQPGAARSSPDATVIDRGATHDPSSAGTGDAMTEPLEMLAEDDAAPWSCRDGTGYANDVVRAAFKAAGVNVRLLVVPYARGKNMTIAGEAVACFSMSRLPELDADILFPEKPLIHLHADYFHNLDKPLQARSQQEIETKIVVGVVVGYEYPASLYQLRDKGLVVLEETPSENLIFKKLTSGRIDAAIAVFDEIKTAESILARARIGAGVVRAFPCGELNCHIGFSRKHPRGEWAREKFNAGFEAIASDGTLRRIEEQWIQTTRAETEKWLRHAGVP